MELCSNRGRLSGEAHVPLDRPCLYAWELLDRISHYSGSLPCVVRLSQDNMVTMSCQKIGKFATLWQ